MDQPVARLNATGSWRDAHEAMLTYFCDQYRMMLEGNLVDHINNFSQYRLVNPQG